MAEAVPPALPVQLDLVVKRVAEAAFTQLKALARSSKIQDSGTRRRDLSDWSRLTMNTLLRLLALVRWMREQHHMQGVLTLSDFLHRCDAAVCNVPNALGDFQVNGLDRVRVPKMDLPSAISVLSTGKITLPRTLDVSVDDPSMGSDDMLTDELDDLLRTRLSRPAEAAALQSLLQQTTPDDGQSAGTLEFRRGVAEFTLPGRFQIGLTVRAAQGPWILCWANILVREHDTLGENQQTRWIEPFLRAHLQRGASLREVLTILQQFCLKLQLTMLRTQATNLQRGRLSNALTVHDNENDGGSGFTVSYWGASAASVGPGGCSIRVSLKSRKNSTALCIHHSPPLACTDNIQGTLPVGAASTDWTQRILPDQVNFEKLLIATMQTRAAMRIEQVAFTLSAKIKSATTTEESHESSSKPRLHVQIADQSDSAGYPYVDITMPSARLELHVRRETGLLQLHQADGWRHDAVLARWQAHLDQGSGVSEDVSSTKESIANMFISTHRRLLLESIIDRARARGARVETPQFHSKGGRAGHDHIEGNVFHSAGTSAPSHGNKAFIRIAAAALDYECSHRHPQHQWDRLGHEQFYLALWISEDDDDDDALHACLGAFSVPSQNAQDGLKLSTLLQVDMDAGTTGAAGGSTTLRSSRSSSGRKRRTLSADRSNTNWVVSVQAGCSSPVGDDEEFHLVDKLLERASSAVMAYRLRQALNRNGLQHVWTSQFQARVALPYATTEPVTIRILPSIAMQWQCQIGLPPGPPELMKTLGPQTTAGMHSSTSGHPYDMLTCDGRDVCLQYGGGHTSCDMELLSLCGDALRITHMAELCYHLSETVHSASSSAGASSSCLKVRCLSLRQVVIECLDKAKTTITVDANLSPPQISGTWASASQRLPPRLRVTFDPNPANHLHFCASFFPPTVYRVVGYSTEVDHRVESSAIRQAEANTTSQATGLFPRVQSGGDNQSEFVHVADLCSCARYLHEQDK